MMTATAPSTPGGTSTPPNAWSAQTTTVASAPPRAAAETFLVGAGEGWSTRLGMGAALRAVCVWGDFVTFLSLRIVGLTWRANRAHRVLEGVGQGVGLRHLRGAPRRGARHRLGVLGADGLDLRPEVRELLVRDRRHGGAPVRLLGWG